ncbi:DUF1565 domain-containing protein [bacterium]|nr:MAG: DUF1565 domain-containing protein [bacterium]
MIVLSLLAATAGLTAPPTIAYVSVSGRDTNPGTASTPWRTLQYACDHGPSGGRIVARGGVYNERVTIRVPLTLVAAGGETPVIDGTGLAVPGDDAAMITIRDVDRVTVAGFDIRNLRTKDSARVPMGILVAGKADAISLSNNRVHHIANEGTNRDAINAFGIAVYGDSTRGAITNLRVEGNEIDHTRTGSSETLALNGNVDGFRVVGNWVHDADNIGIVAIGFEGTSPIRGQDQARNGLIAGNRVENVSSRANPAYRGSLGADGIYVDGGTSITIERNVVRAADIGIEVASEHVGKTSSAVVVRSNLVTLCGLTGISIGGYDAKRGGTQGCTLVNNTLARNDTSRSGTGEFSVQYNVKGVTFANNVVAASTQGVLMSTAGGKGVAVGLASDTNLFFAPVTPSWRWQGKTYTTLAGFAGATGLDARSRLADPRFVNPDGGDFHVAPDSPARDRGRSFGAAIDEGLDLDRTARIRGAAIDLGSYELPPIGSNLIP